MRGTGSVRDKKEHPMIVAIASALHLSLVASCLTTREIFAPSPVGHVIAAGLATAAPDQHLQTVIVISGAGAHSGDYSTDGGNARNGNEACRLLRNSLAAGSYAVVRFDERGTGRSTGDYAASATTATLAEDIESLMAALAMRPEVDARRFILLGHSEGAAIAWLVASHRAEVAAVVSLAGPAWPGQRIMESQHAYLVDQAAWWSTDDSTRESRRAALMREHTAWIANEPWYRFFLTFDPPVAFARLRVPLLLVQGDQDWRVTPGQAVELAALAKARGSLRATTVVLEGYDHGFRYRDPMDPFPSAVINLIGGWVMDRVPARRRSSACDKAP
jgi:pimeloyl-ACP methyl ester carboxylesterase